jgi:hypothetical protein
MGAVTPTGGLPYPAPTDPVAAGADDIRRLAQAVDIHIQAGTTNVGSLVTSTPVSAAITFPAAFATTPAITLTVRGAAAPQNFALSTQNETATGFTLWATRIAGAAGSVGVSWTAVGKSTVVP